MRIYTDTSVFGGYFDEEFAKWSRRLFVEFEEGLNTAVISDTTLREFLARVGVQPPPELEIKKKYKILDAKKKIQPHFR